MAPAPYWMLIVKAILFILWLCAVPVGFAQNAAPEISKENRRLIQGALEDFDSKSYDAALEKLQKLEKDLPGDAFVMNLLGAAYTKKKDYATARTYFDKVLVGQPDFFPARFNVGELLFLQRDYAGALEYFEKMRQTDARNELLMFKVFLCQLQLGDKDAAEKTMKAIKCPGDTPAWYYAQAAWESKNGDNKKAREYLTGAKYIFGKKTALFDETFDDLGIKLR